MRKNKKELLNALFLFGFEMLGESPVEGVIQYAYGYLSITIYETDALIFQNGDPYMENGEVTFMTFEEAADYIKGELIAKSN